MKHEFQPILDDEKYSAAVIYIARQAGLLASRVLGHGLPIDTLTIFAQSTDEYEFIENHLHSIGSVSDRSHISTLYVSPTNTTVLNDYQIKLLGVRQPDVTRPEVGYADYPVANYQTIKDNNIDNPYLSEIISASGLNLLELKQPEFDVRGYVIEEEKK